MPEIDTGNTMKTMSVSARSSLRGFRLAFTNMLLATFFIFFAFANAQSFLEKPRLSVLLIVVAETIAAIFLIIRRNPDKTWHSWQTWLSTACGTAAPLLLRPVDAAENFLVGDIVLVFGFVAQSLANVAVILFGITFLVIRIHYEEDLLTQQADYAQYMNKTRWRLIPSVW